MNDKQLDDLDLMNVLPCSKFNSPTEHRNPKSMNLNQMNSHQIIQLMLEDTFESYFCLKNHLMEIDALIKTIINCLKSNGRLIYIGAGNSGRLAMLDALECPSTFGCNADKIQALLAGGIDSFKLEQGCFEDRFSSGYDSLQKMNLNEQDFVLGISASGQTKFVWGALYASSKSNCKNGLLTFNPHIEPKLNLSHLIKLNVGPEVLTGSTRLKCGTITKIVLNMISTAVMIKLGTCLSNLMINVQPTNFKLKQRIKNILTSILEQTDLKFKEDYLVELLEKNDYEIKKTLTCLNLTKFID